MNMIKIQPVKKQEGYTWQEYLAIVIMAIITAFGLFSFICAFMFILFLIQL